MQDNDQTVASLLISQDNYLTAAQIAAFDKFIKKDFPHILNTNTEIFTSSANGLVKIVYTKIINLSYFVKPFRHDDYLGEDRTLVIEVYGNIQQCVKTIDVVSQKETVEVIQNEGGYKNVLIAKIPSLITKHEIDTNPYDIKGVFLHKGAPLTFLPYDTYPENKPMSLYRKIGGNQVVAVDFWSQDYENPTVVQRYSVFYKKMNAKKNTKVVFMQFNMFQDEFPVILMLYAFGLTNSVEILNAISLDKTIQSMFVSSFSDIKFTFKEKAGLPIVTQADAIEELAHRVKYMNYKSIIDDKVPGKNELFIKKILRNNIFPHIHGSERTKAIYLCSLVSKCLRVAAGYEEVDNRDSYNFKRLESPRNIFMNIYASSWEKIMRDIRKTAKRIFQNNGSILFEEGSVIPNLTDSIRFDYLSKDIIGVLNVGFWKKSQYHSSRTVCVSLRNDNNLMESYYQCRKLPAPSNLENNSNYSPRLFFGDHFGFVCCYSTPEGKQIGLTTELALSSNISIGNEEMIPVIKNLLLTPERMDRLSITPIDEVPISTIQYLVTVIVNGEPICCTKDGYGVYQELRNLRFDGSIVRDHVGFVYDGTSININTCSGRLYRPLLTVENNELVLPAKAIEEIKNGTITSFTGLLAKYPRSIEFLDTDEYTNMSMVAVLPSDLIKEKKLEEESKHIADEAELTFREFTHCEIHGIFSTGIVASTTPFSNHNQGPKNGAQCQMRKQAISAFADNKINNKTRKNELWYPGRPLTSTFTARVMHIDDLPPGDNVIVAIASYLGFNQEDSNIMNKSAIERGMFRANFTRLYKDVIDNTTDSSIGVFKKPNLMDISTQKNISYNNLNENGWVNPGTYVVGDRNDVLINKQVPVSVGKNGNSYKNVPTKVQRGEEGIVEIVQKGTNQDGNKYIKVSVLSERVPEIGDKFASRHGQKNTLGNLYHQAYMPFSTNYTADVVINPHMLPTRMTTGQLLEAMISKYANATCQFMDVTPYQNVDIDDLKKKMKELGFDEYGKEHTICGLTGKPMEMNMFIGPTFYQRLRHMVADKVHARGAGGPITQSTMQPTDGRSKGGGYKIGEMERDGLIAHGIATSIRQLFTNHSDGKEFHVCQNEIDGKVCGTFAYKYDTTESGEDIYLCPMCQSSLHTVQFGTTYTFKSLIQLLYGLKLRCRIILERGPIESFD